MHKYRCKLKQDAFHRPVDYTHPFSCILGCSVLSQPLRESLALELHLDATTPWGKPEPFHPWGHSRSARLKPAMMGGDNLSRETALLSHGPIAAIISSHWNNPPEDPCQRVNECYGDFSPA